MDFHQSVKHSVANIQDELLRIQTLASLFDSKPSEAQSAFHSRVVSEFNYKIHKLKSENLRLNHKNKELLERVKALEQEVSRTNARQDLSPSKARPSKSDGAMRHGFDATSLKLSDKKSVDKPKLEISSSPIKRIESNHQGSPRHIEDSNGKVNLTSSQFNKLATQYSDASSQLEVPQRETLETNAAKFHSIKRHGSDVQERPAAGAQLRSSSPFKKSKSVGKRERTSIFKGTFASDDESEEAELVGLGPIVGDSQDEFEPLGKTTWSPSKRANDPSPKRSTASTKPKYPSHYTALQRVEFLRNYLRPKVTDKNFTIDFSRNPITEKRWVPEDFAINENWKPPRKVNSNLGVMTKAKEKTYDEFFVKAGLGRKSNGPVWDSDNDSDHAIDEKDWVRSQVMDKYSSPPGYMVGDFADTQEVERNKVVRNEKDNERIKRRLKSAITGGEFVFYESVFNDFVKAGKFVNGP